MALKCRQFDYKLPARWIGIPAGTVVKFRILADPEPLSNLLDWGLHCKVLVVRPWIHWCYRPIYQFPIHLFPSEDMFDMALNTWEWNCRIVACPPATTA